MSRPKNIFFRNFDWALFFSALLLMLIGLAAIYSVDLSRGETLLYSRKQLLAGLTGFILFFLFSFARPAFFRASAKWWYLLSLMLLAGVLLFGTEVRGTKGWFAFGSFSFQPVEFAKAGLIFILAYVISSFGRRFEKPLFFFGTAVIAFLPVALVLLQPDLGSAVLLGLVWFGLILLAGTRKSYLALLLIILCAVSVASWFFLLADYQKDRLLTFVHPKREPLGASYNITQSIIAVGAGQILGRGLGFGSQSQLRFLPEAQTDFIFSVIGEELGLAGAGAVLLLFGVLLWRLSLIARRTSNDFLSAVVCGTIILLFCQFFVNVGANIGLLPITGITLPFISYGGSSLAVSLLLLGVAESAAAAINIRA